MAAAMRSKGAEVARCPGSTARRETIKTRSLGTIAVKSLSPNAAVNSSGKSPSPPQFTMIDPTASPSSENATKW